MLAARTVGGLEEVDDRVRAAGGSATLVPLDLREFIKIDELAAALYERYGRLDILVGNAAEFGVFSPLGHIDPKLWGEIIDLDLTANWRLIRAMDPLLRPPPSMARAGVQLTTAVAREALPCCGPYAVSKAALEAMVRNSRRRSGPRLGTRISTCCDPGIVSDAGCGRGSSQARTPGDSARHRKASPMRFLHTRDRGMQAPWGDPRHRRSDGVGKY